MTTTAVLRLSPKRVKFSLLFALSHSMVARISSGARMTSRQIFGLVPFVLLAACQASTVQDAANQVAETVSTLPALPKLPSQADVCTDPEVQTALKSLIHSAIEAQLQQGSAIGLYQGDMGFVRLATYRAVARSTDKITFSQTTVEHADSETHGTTCATSLSIVGDTGADVRPRISFRVQPSLDAGNGDGVVTLAQPADIAAAIPLLAAAVLRVKLADSAKDPISSSPPVADRPVAATPPDSLVDESQETSPNSASPTLNYLPTANNP